MLAIRLTRIGAKKRPTYRVVVTEARTPRDSRVVEALGYYNPKTQPATLKVDRERVAHWLKSGRAAERDGEEPAQEVQGAGGRRERCGRRRGPVSHARDVAEVVTRALVDRPEAVRVTERRTAAARSSRCPWPATTSGASSGARAARPPRSARWWWRRPSGTGRA